jgi:hypothetical protein
MKEHFEAYYEFRNTRKGTRIQMAGYSIMKSNLEKNYFHHFTFSLNPEVSVTFLQTRRWKIFPTALRI